MLDLTRYGSTPMGTFGELLVGNYRLYTIECPWLDNQPYISCIPDGYYDLVPHSTRAHPDTWALVNHDLGVYHQEDAKAQRFAILFHTGNIVTNFEGCIGPGFSLATLYKRWSVAKSDKAMDAIRRTMKQSEFTKIRIRWQ